MKTAVEEFLNAIKDQIPLSNEHLEMIESYALQCKEIEKEQMKDSYKKGFAYRDTWNWELNVDWDEDSTKENENEFEQYYNETFKSK